MEKELTGRDVLVWLSVFFLCIIAVNVYFVVVSVATFRGEDEQKPYLQGIEYNQTLARRDVQAKLGWTANIAADRLASGHVRVDITLKQANGAPSTVEKLVGELRHPSDENRDHQLHLVQVRNGEYIADVSGVSAGAWDVIVSTTASETPFEATRRLWVP